MNVTDAQSEAVKRSIIDTQPEIEGTGNLFMMLCIVSLVCQQKRVTIYTTLQKKIFHSSFTFCHSYKLQSI